MEGTIFASGGSHGGDGGADDQSRDSPPAYGSFVQPDMFGSAGGDTNQNYKGLFTFTVKPLKYELRFFEILINP